MKRYLGILTVLSLLAAACSKESSTPTGISLNREAFTAAQAGETLVLEVIAPTAPSIKNAPEWISLTDLAYKDNKMTVNLVVKANYAYEPREATLTVTAGSESRNVKVTQEGRKKEETVIGESAATAARNMGAGWNLGNTLDSNSGDVDNMWIEAFSDRSTASYETAWGQPVTTRELIHMFKEAGFNTIRVPVTWYPHMGTVAVSVYTDWKGDQHGRWDVSTWNGYDVDSKWMARVREVVEYVLDEGMYCILNVHHDTGTSTTAWLRADKEVYGSVKDRYVSLWKQIATEFADCGEKLLFESFNEMLDTDNHWNSSTADAHEAINMYNALFVSTVRSTGGNNTYRNLILNTYAASCQKQALKDFRLPEDSMPGHLLAEVHSYAPYDFAFDTTQPKTVFDAACEAEVRGLVDNMNIYLVSQGIPCVLGEFGADTSRREEAELAKQAACYVSAAAKYDIPCLYWMTLSDGDDRAVPKWTKPAIKDAILKAWKENKK